MKIQKQSRGQPWRWVGWVVHATPWHLYPQERDPVAIVQEAGGPHDRPGRVGCLRGSSPRIVQRIVSRSTEYTIPPPAGPPSHYTST